MALCHAHAVASHTRACRLASAVCCWPRGWLPPCAHTAGLCVVAWHCAMLIPSHHTRTHAVWLVPCVTGRAASCHRVLTRRACVRWCGSVPCSYPRITHTRTCRLANAEYLCVCGWLPLCAHAAGLYEAAWHCAVLIPSHHTRTHAVGRLPWPWVILYGLSVVLLRRRRGRGRGAG